MITEMNIYIQLKGTIAIPKQEQPQTIETKKQYLKFVLHLLIALAKWFKTLIWDTDVWLIEWSDIYDKTTERLWEYYRHEPALNTNINNIDFSADNNYSILFKFKEKISIETNKDGTKDVEIIVPLKCPSRF